MFKLTLFFLIINLIAVSSFSVNVTKISENNSLKTSNSSEPRTIDKHFNLLYGLYKMFKSMKSKSNVDGKKSKSSVEVVPFDGLYRGDYNNRRVEKFVTLADLNKQEGIMGMNMNTAMVKKEKPEKPEFWLFDKYASKVDLLFMTKVLLKIIVFKKIVKFIALICLLFFLPTISDNSSSDDDKKDSRNLDIYGEVYF